MRSSRLPSPCRPRFGRFLLGLAACFHGLAALAASTPDPLGGSVTRELDRRHVWQDGRRLTFVRIAPPPPRAPVPASEPPPSPVAPPEPADEVEPPPLLGLTIHGTVYVTGPRTAVTEIQMLHLEGAPFRSARVFVPLDLRHVGHFLELPGTEVAYGYSLFLTPCPLESLRPQEIPPELPLLHPTTDSTPAYIVVGAPAVVEAMEPELVGLERLFAHLTLHRDSLADAFAEQEAAQAAAAREAARRPARPRDEVIYYWRLNNPSTL